MSTCCGQPLMSSENSIFKAAFTSRRLRRSGSKTQWVIVIGISFIPMKQPIDVAEADPFDERHITWWATNIFRRTGTRTGDADRIDLAALSLELGLNPDLVFPQIAEIVLVADSLAHAQLEIGERYLAVSRVAVTLASPSRTIVPAVQLERVQVIVLPAECNLDCSVQRVERHFFRNE